MYGTLIRRSTVLDLVYGIIIFLYLSRFALICLVLRSIELEHHSLMDLIVFDLALMICVFVITCVIRYVLLYFGNFRF